MLGDPNPALRGVHQVLKTSEQNEAEAAAMAADAQAMVAAKIASEEAATASAAEAEAAALERPSLKSATFVFQKTGREVGISWGQRNRYGIDGEIHLCLQIFVYDIAFLLNVSLAQKYLSNQLAKTRKQHVITFRQDMC